MIDQEYVPEQFRPFIGNNHNVAPKTMSHHGGVVDLSSHVGKPLSNRLWEDLTKSMHATNIRIYHEDDSRWCDGPCDGYVEIELGVDYNVKSISFAPYMPPYMVRYMEGNAKVSQFSVPLSKDDLPKVILEAVRWMTSENSKVTMLDIVEELRFMKREDVVGAAMQLIKDGKITTRTDNGLEFLKQ